MEDSKDIITAVIMFCLIAGVLIFTGRKDSNKSIEYEFTFKQLKDYFFKKHYCKDCNSSLKRFSKDEFLGEGWTKHPGTVAYSKNYKRTFYLKCPACSRIYTSDDF
ncbi:hypothetical protein D3P09_04890 [Paenibacillus pinisoli]|uniref:Uncharacterized protein n=1 Tax=Paenibacillus pinisoli TaxID=1276110 RepID=A0A3A6PHK2_9BACL|nr:hypothetical protein [Paenibacillus pinisoli]RJX41322.1 hypothetical protein D3P09_04890 [Paenibacillus pinisoli]